MEARPRKAALAFAVAITASALLSVLAGCGPFGSAAPTICDQGVRTELLNSHLDSLMPSQPFTLKSGSTGWIQVTVLPSSYEGLFGDVGGVAEVHPVHSGVPPNLAPTANGGQESRDPSIVIDKAGTWQQLPMGPGDWQLYSFSNPGIEVVSCPAN